MVLRSDEPNSCVKLLQLALKRYPAILHVTESIGMSWIKVKTSANLLSVSPFLVDRSEMLLPIIFKILLVLGT